MAARALLSLGKIGDLVPHECKPVKLGLFKEKAITILVAPSLVSR